MTKHSDSKNKSFLDFAYMWMEARPGNEMLFSEIQAFNIVII